jgi:uncharacterized membrane protein YqaE (UPF0057 family)/predicted RNA-binding protein YlxR (DUF448 family)
MKKVSQVLVAVLVAVGLFSCNVIDITKKRYSNGYYISRSGNRNADAKAKESATKEKTSDVQVAANQNKVEALPSGSTQDNVVTPENTEETEAVNTASSKIVTTKTKAKHSKKEIQETNSKPVFAVKSSKLAVSLLQIKEKKAIEKESKSDKRDDGVHLLLLFILALILPPVAVFLKKGLDTMFWLSLILTILFWVPGVIFALLVVFDVI